MEQSKRHQLAIEASIIMFLCAAGLACLQVFRSHGENPGYMVMVGVPASAACIFVALAAFSGHLVNGSKVRFPYNFTLPVVFCALLPVCSLLIATPERGLMAVQETLIYAHVWQQPVELVVVLFIEIVALSLYSLFPRP